MEAQRKGRSYEDWLATFLPGICRRIGIDISDNPRVDLRKQFAGSVWPHKVDIALEDDETLVLVDCKNRGKLDDAEFLGDYHALMRIAHAHADRRVYALIISSARVSPKYANEISDGIISVPRNLTSPLKVLYLPALTIRGWATFYEPLISSSPLHAMRLSGEEEARSLEELVTTMRTGANMSERLAAAYEVVRRPETADGLRVSALCEAASSYLHFGLDQDALIVAGIASKLAVQSHFRQAFLVLESMARYRKAALRDGISRRPGMPAAQALKRVREDLAPEHRASGAGFIAAWIARYDDPAESAPYFTEAEQAAEQLGGEAGAYLALVTRVRRGELLPSRDREDALGDVEDRLRDLGSRHLQLAQELIDRVRTGGDTSVLSTFGRGEILRV